MSGGKRILFGITGGIAAYKALDVISSLKKLNYNIDVIMTKSAQEFVTPLSFQALSGNQVIIDMFEEPKAWEIQHISLAKAADIIVVAPATANIIGKIAGGIADDMLSTTIMASKVKVIFAPAMNTNMYLNPIVQGNIAKLKALGYIFINPGTGRLACGDVGEGKLADTKLITETIISKLYDLHDLVGKKVLVTAGPTIAPIDPVRHLTNKSSGKMGYSIACEARDRGAEVTLISGPTNLDIPYGVDFINVDTNEEMGSAVLQHFEKNDIIIKAAAVGDFRIKEYSSVKIKKTQEEFALNLVKDTDILKSLGEIKKNQILVGFAAESNDLIKNADLKLKNKNLDYIVANDILSKETGFGTDDNKVTVLTKKGESISLGKMSKRRIAREIFNIIIKDL